MPYQKMFEGSKKNSLYNLRKTMLGGSKKNSLYHLWKTMLAGSKENMEEILEEWLWN